MKAWVAVVAIVLVASLPGCGGDDATATSAGATSAGRAAPEAKQAPEPDYPLPEIPPNRGPLKKLVVRDLEVGKGAMAHWGDELKVRYVGVYWETETVFTQHWDSTLTFKLDGKKFGPGWQRGIEGMRVGGRREILIPAALLFGGETDAAYVVKLDKVKSGAGTSG